MSEKSDLEVVWGAKNIGKVIGAGERQAYNLLEAGHIPGKKIGGKWTSTHGQLREMILGSSEPKAA